MLEGLCNLGVEPVRSGGIILSADGASWELGGMEAIDQL